MVLNIKITLKFNYIYIEEAFKIPNHSWKHDLLIPKTSNLKKTSTTSVFRNSSLIKIHYREIL